MASEEYAPISLAGSSNGAAVSSPSYADQAAGLSLFIDNPEVANMPEEGLITFRFKRGPLTLRESDDSRPGSANAQFTLTEICDVTEDKGSSAKEPEAKDVVDELFKSIQEAAEKKAEDE